MIKMQLPFDIILLGDIAAGKGVQCKVLLKKFKFVNLDMGAELRKREKYDEDIAADQAKKYNQGKLASSAIVKNILTEYIENLKSGDRIIFNGNPKKVIEAKHLLNLFKAKRRELPVLIYFKLSKNESYKRVELRSRKEHRVDDVRSIFEERLKRYAAGVLPTFQFLTNVVEYRVVNASGSIEEVNGLLLKAISSLVKKYEKLHKKRK